MATVTVTANLRDVRGVPDNTTFSFYSPISRLSDDDSIVTTQRARVTPVAGVLTVELEPGPCTVSWTGSQPLNITIPDSDSDLWPLIAVAVGIPPGSPQQTLIEAVNVFLSSNASPMGAQILTAANSAAARVVLGAPGKHESAPVFAVSRFYGGTLGDGDDQVCVQNTIEAAADAGGGTVIMPPNPLGVEWKYSQLVIPPGVYFKGSGWNSFGAVGTAGGTRMRQLTGVNDDSIIFSFGTSPFIGPFGISDLSLLGAAGSTAGHAINFRVDEDGDGVIQDLTTIERIYGAGFAGSVIRATAGVPIVISDIDGVMNGRYTVEIEDTGGVSSVYQVLLRNMSGDGNTGTLGADGAGAVVYLKSLKDSTNSAPAVSIFGIKSEYRVRETWAGGDNTSMGCFHALIVEDCTAPITVTGVQHISNGTTTRKPGNPIQIVGPGRPNLVWQSVNVRGTYPAQTGTAPVRVYDEVLAKGFDVPHGSLGPSALSVEKLSLGENKLRDSNGNTALGIVATASAVNNLEISNRAAGGTPSISSVGSSTNIGLAFAVKGSGEFSLYNPSSSTPTLTAFNNDANTDLNLKTTGTGVVKANGVDVVTLTGAQTMTNKTITSPVGIAKGDVGLGNVDNTSNATERAAAATLAAKTLTAPKIVNNGFIADENGNEQIVFGTTASAVNEIKISNAAAGGKPTIAAQGGDTNVDLALVTKGTGVVRFNGATAPTYSGNGFVAFTGTRITPRIGTTASNATISISADSIDQYNVTALAVGATIAAPSGTPTDGQPLRVRIKDNGTSQTLAYNAAWRALGVTLPTATVISKTVYLDAVYNFADTKWDVIRVSQEV